MTSLSKPSNGNLEEFIEDTIAYLSLEATSVHVTFPTPYEEINTLSEYAKFGVSPIVTMMVDYVYLEDTLKTLHSLFEVKGYITRIGFKLGMPLITSPLSVTIIFKISWKKI